MLKYILLAILAFHLKLSLCHLKEKEDCEDRHDDFMEGLENEPSQDFCIKEVPKWKTDFLKTIKYLKIEDRNPNYIFSCTFGYLQINGDNSKTDKYEIQIEVKYEDNSVKLLDGRILKKEDLFCSFVKPTDEYCDLDKAYQKFMTGPPPTSTVVDKNFFAICYNSESRHSYSEHIITFKPKPEWYETIKPQVNLTFEYETILDKRFNKGHLSPKGDVPELTQRYTYNYMNAAPQLKKLNGRNWNNLENKLREHAGKSKGPIRVFTGTHESIAKFSSDNLKVPMWFWKLVYDSTEKKAIALFGLNDPSITNITEVPHLCEISIVKWIDFPDYRTNVDKGFIIACSLKDFLKIVTYFKWDNDVNPITDDY